MSSIPEIFASLGYTGNNIYDLSFFNYQSPLVINSHSIQKDQRVSPYNLVRGFQNSLIALAIFESIDREVTPSEFAFYGNSKTINTELKNLLEASMDFNKLLKDWVTSFYGTGGDLLVYEDTNGLIRSQTFFENGKEAVGFRIDEFTGKISEYAILDLKSSQIVEMVDIENALHLKYANPHNSPLGVTPAMTLLPLWELKNAILAANETIYKNGIQAAKLISPKVEAIANATSNNKEFYLDEIDRLAEEMNAATGLHNRNKTIVSAIPGIQVDDLQMNNSQMRTVEVVDNFIDKQTYITYSQDESLFDTGKSKYNNAEIIRDTRSKAIQKKSKIITKDAVQNWIMKRIYPKYNPDKYPFEYSQIVTDETIRDQEQKTESLKVMLDFFVKAKATGINVKISPEKKESLKEVGLIIEDDLPVKPQETEITNEEVLPKNQERQITREEKETVVTRAEKPDNIEKAKQVLTKALSRQLQSF